MQVAIKSFDVNMQVKSNGIEFEVRSPDGTTPAWRLLPYYDRLGVVQRQDIQEKRHKDQLE